MKDKKCECSEWTRQFNKWKAKIEKKHNEPTTLSSLESLNKHKTHECWVEENNDKIREEHNTWLEESRKTGGDV